MDRQAYGLTLTLYRHPARFERSDLENSGGLETSVRFALVSEFPAGSAILRPNR